jgi:hypothetical protein
MRETLYGLLTFMVIWALLAPDDVGKWFGKVSAGYFVSITDMTLGDKQ